MKKKKTEILLASRKAWKQAVRFLSCVVVFCTVYALILPAITQEAQAYCGSAEHKHTDECYTEILSCTREEHSHSKECYDEEGSLICETEEHQHTQSCYRKVFDCTEEEHTHSLICFSDPAADLETEKDWEKSLPKEKKETTRENVIEIAKSQENVTESTKNYEVDSETEIRGISRYGQWDGDPYENWTGAFARFVLVSAGISPEKIYSENDVIDWMNELNKKEQLSAISEGKEGDVVFIYDKEEEIHAGIILSMDEKENSFTAMMGDWGNKVSRQKFSLEDDKVHSIFRLPVTDDKEEVKEAKDEPAAEEPDSKDAENEIKEDPAEEAAADKDETEKRETNDSSSEESDSKSDIVEDETKNSDMDSGEEKDSTINPEYDFTETVETEDGTVITASWNKTAFKEEEAVGENSETLLNESSDQELSDDKESDQKNGSSNSENIVFQAKKVELSEEEQKQIRSYLKLSEDEFIDLTTFDLTFYKRGKNAELEKVEPLENVNIQISSKEKLTNDQTRLIHMTENGKVEDLSDSLNKTEESEVDQNKEQSEISFESDSFSTYSLVNISGNEVWVNSYADINKYCYSGNGSQTLGNNQYLKLGKDITFNKDDMPISVEKNVRIDMNNKHITDSGRSHTSFFHVKNGGSLSITNNQKANEDVHSGTTAGDGYDPKTHTVYFQSNVNEQVSVTNIGIIYPQAGTVHGPAIQVESGGVLNLEDTAIVHTSNGDAISTSGTVTLKQAYLVNGQRGIQANGGTVNIYDGYIANNMYQPQNPGDNNLCANLEQAGAAIKAYNGATINLGEKGHDSKQSVHISYNRIFNAGPRTYGGAIQLRGANLNLYNSVLENK